MSQNIIRLPAVIKKTGLSRSSIYKLISENDFPKQIKLTERTMCFVESEVDSWIEARISASKAG